MLSALQKFDKGFVRLENIISVICGALLVAIMLLGAADVLGRYLFNHPILGALEISQIMMAGIVLLGWAYTYRAGMHVKVDLFITRYPPRVRTVVDILTTILSLALFIIIAQQSLNSAIENMHAGKFLPTLKYPAYPYYFFVPLGAALLCIELIIHFLRLLPGLKRSS